MNSVAVKEAKNNFTQLLHLVEKDEPVQISRHGKTVAVLSSVEYFENANKSSPFAESLDSWQKKSAAILSNEDIDSVFNSERKIESSSRANEFSNIADLWDAK